MFIKIPVNKASSSSRKSVFGVGVNDSDYITQPTVNGKLLCSPSYKAWKNMLERCYSDKYHKNRPTYSGCTVTLSWLKFSSFDSWYDDNYIEGYELDKDIKVKGNKIYSPDTCLFVSGDVNKLMHESGGIDSIYPTGVYFDKNKSKFKARVGASGNRKHIGTFDTEIEAHKAYKIAKNQQIQIAMESNKCIAKYLKAHMY